VWDWLARKALLLNVTALTQGFQDVLGAKPITFYQWPEPPPGTGPAPSGQLAGAATASPMPGDDAPSSGGLQQPAVLAAGATGNQGIAATPKVV
jgi:hypothetical protein